MRAYRLDHLSDRALLQALAALVAEERAATAALLAHIAEVDARRLYLPAGFPSMFSYAVHELGLSEDAAYKRIQAARAARRFPMIFEALAEGRLHLTGVGLLAPHLTEANAGELLAAAAHQTKAEVEQLLARRFPRTESLPLVQVMPVSVPRADGHVAPGQVGARIPEGLAGQLAPAQVRDLVPEAVRVSGGQLAPAQVRDPLPKGVRVSGGQLAPAQVRDPLPEGGGTLASPHALAHAMAPPRPRLTPIAAQRFELRVCIGQETHDKLRHAQALLGHALPSGDLAAVIDRALDALIEQLEKRKLAATSRPRPRRSPSENPRHIPAHVKRAVWERDRGQCTYVSEKGRRCSARKLLEFDHIEPVARGGQATVSQVRLRCRGHNQLEAERTFGAEFMRAKREEARRAAEEARPAALEARARNGTAKATPGPDPMGPTPVRDAAKEQVQDVIACLRTLGFRADEARRAAEACAMSTDATLEEHVRAALKSLCPKARFHRPKPGPVPGPIEPGARRDTPGQGEGAPSRPAHPVDGTSRRRAGQEPRRGEVALVVAPS